MLSPKDFKNSVLKPIMDVFEDDPDRLHAAFSVIWAIDAYASHLALDRRGGPTTDVKARSKIEKGFKDAVCNVDKDGHWQFRIIREASNSTKHGLRSTSRPAVESAQSVQSQTIDGALAYFGNSAHWGNQVVIDVSWQFIDAQQKWLCDQGRLLEFGPFTKWVPVLDIAKPAIETLETFSFSTF